MIWIALFSVLLAAPAAGDWLVMRDGTRLETDGAWEVKGRQVIFTRPGGALAALRLADVDLDASTEATEAAVAAEQAPGAPEATASVPQATRRPSRLVLTNDDIPSRADDDGETDAADDSGESGADDAFGEEAEDSGEDPESIPPAAAPPVAPSGSSLEVVSWRERESTSIDGLEIVGTVRNGGRNVAAAVDIQVKVFDEEGNQVLETKAFLQKPSLAPGDSSSFRALLPGIYVLLAEPVFDLGSEGFTIQGTAQPTGSSDDGDQDDFDDFSADEPPP